MYNILIFFMINHNICVSVNVSNAMTSSDQSAAKELQHIKS